MADMEKENRLALEAEEICNSLQRTSLASHKYERRSQQSRSGSGSARFNSTGRRHDNNNNNGGNLSRTSGGGGGQGVRSSSSFSSEGGRRRADDPVPGTHNNGLTRSVSHNSFRRYDSANPPVAVAAPLVGVAPLFDPVAANNMDMRARRFPPLSVAHPHGSSAAMPMPLPVPVPVPVPKQPFCIEVVPRDLEICELTAETMRSLYSKIAFDDEMISKINQLAINAQSFLQLQQQNLTEFYESKRQHDIEVWLASCSEEERRRYLERMQKS